MGLKPSYKQTEVGVIPKDWDAILLGAVTSDIGDGIHATPVYSATGDYYFINGNNLRDGQIVITAETKTVDHSEFKKHRKNLGDGSILMSINGTIGNLGLFAGEAVVLGKSAAYLNVKESVSKFFVYHSIQTEPVKRQFSNGLTGTTIRNLGLGTIRNTIIALPPTKAEQGAIAAALSDADALIKSLEQLVSKKRQLKQGAMQELLTGKKRLPGFDRGLGIRQTDIGMIPADWNCEDLPALLAQNPSGIKIGPFGSALKKEFLTKDGYKVYGQENVYERDMTIGDRFIDAEHFRKLRSCDVKPGDFLISMMGTVGKCFIVPEAIEPGIMDSHLLRLKLDPLKLLAEFLSQLFQTRTVFNQIKQLSVGGIMEGLSSTIIKRLRLPVPEVREQTAIAAILSDMDTEIATLEAKLAKARQVKQGMMQELLTGRIRLV